MSLTTIIVVVAIIAVLYLVFSGSGAKLFKKKEHKVKASKSNEEKFKDVIPKEKEKKETKVKITKTAKKEKLKEDIKKELDEKKGGNNADAEHKSSVFEPVSGEAKVTKITKEDFLKSNMEVPASLLTEEEKKQATAKSLPKAKEQPSSPYDFSLDDDDPILGKDPFDLQTSSGDALDSMFGDLDDDPFAGVDIDALLNELKSETGDDSFAPQPTSKLIKAENKFEQKTKSDYFTPTPSFSGVKGTDNPFTGKTLNERFEEVFGTSYENMGGTELGKEIIIGDILSGNRATLNRTKRAEREKRRKWM